MHEALKIIASRYSEQQLMKAQDVIGDLRDELAEKRNESEENYRDAQTCDRVFDLLSDAINLNN